VLDELQSGAQEIMGMLAAVEMWVKRDHKAEWAQWESWLKYIGEQVTSVSGVTIEVLQPEDLSNHAPRLRIKWNGAALGITGREVEDILLKGRPRIVIGGSTGNRPDEMASSVTIMPYMMMPDDHKIAAQALHNVLSKPPKIENPVRPSGQAESIAGEWDVHIDYVRGGSSHKLSIQQSANNITGTHHGEIIEGALRGSVYGNELCFHSSHKVQGTAITYDFHGQAGANSMSGTVAMGEYGQGRWTATRQ
jgi:D-glucosaminate-6-phosphate ammonia-lyase